MIQLTSPVTGTAITGLTSPTYTVISDGSAPAPMTKSWYVSALGGTQTGVETHTIASPFTISWKNPAALLIPGTADVTGVYRSPMRQNRYELLTRKGGRPLSGQAHRLNMVRTQISVEAGAETADPMQLAAMLSAHIGVLQQQINGILDTVKTGSA